MKYLIYFFTVFCFMLLISCNNDDYSSYNYNNNNVSIAYFTEQYERPANENTAAYQYNLEATLTNNRYNTYTKATYYNGEETSNNIYTKYQFTNNNLTTLFYNPEDDITETAEYFYDENNELIGVNHYLGITARIKNVGNNTYFVERIDGELTDTNPTVTMRSIAILDDNNNIIEAGMDINFDEIIDEDHHNYFSYDANNNLISILTFNNESANITYSDIRNTENFIEDSNFGKKTLRLINIEGYAFGVNIDNIKKFHNSEFLSTDEVSQYELLETGPYNFYTKAVKHDSNTNATTIREYFFN